MPARLMPDPFGAPPGGDSPAGCFRAPCVPPPRAERINIRGTRDLATICTSHVERCNLTIRTFIKRFARLALGFSKKFENLCAAAALHVGVYNFVRVHRTLRVTPAMAAGVTDTLWDMPRFYDAVAEHGEQMKRTAKVKRLIDRLRQPE